MDAAVKAYYQGRNDAHCYGAAVRKMAAPFEQAALVEAWRQGVRDLLAEDRLSEDAEWDQD
jgi:hypothetical protein